MKVVFLLGSPSISGGTYVIFQHALKCLEMGLDVTIVTDEEATPDRIKWHEGAEKLTFKKYKEVRDVVFDVAIATWYRTVYELVKIKAKSYIYFVQSIESNFYPEKKVKWLVNSTYILPLSIITEATWIKDYLKEYYTSDATLVKNGIRKDIYTPEGDKYPKEKNHLRVLIEGPVDIFYKNVPRTIELVKKSKAEEIWLLTSSDIDSYPGVDRVFSRQTLSECAKIYRSCDVLVKLSYVEGMFGPPLEMFHCGGTAITYDVTGYDEYLVNNVNSIVIKTDKEQEVIKAINKLHDDSKLLNKLKQNGLKTAEKWPNWDQASNEFYQAVLKYSKVRINEPWFKMQIAYLWNSFAQFEEMPSFKTYLKNKLKEKLPFFYKIYKKIRYHE